jgi:hypothetical protein
MTTHAERYPFLSKSSKKATRLGPLENQSLDGPLTLFNAPLSSPLIGLIASKYDLTWFHRTNAQLPVENGSNFLGNFKAWYWPFLVVRDSFPSYSQSSCMQLTPNQAIACVSQSVSMTSWTTFGGLQTASMLDQHAGLKLWTPLQPSLEQWMPRVLVWGVHGSHALKLHHYYGVTALMPPSLTD